MITILDISAYQANVRWLDLPSNIDGFYFKNSEGLTKDSSYITHVSGARANNYKYGAYYFAHPELHSPSESVNFFSENINKTTLRPVLDYEWGGAKATEEWAREFSRGFKKHWGMYPFIYTNPSMLNHFSKPVAGGLWIASFGRNDGRDYVIKTVSPWKHYVLHQFTSKGKVQGIEGFVDVSHRNNTIYALLWR